MVLVHFVEGSRDHTTQTSTPKSLEEVAIEVMKADKVAELFQTMTIVNLNMGNLIIEVNTLKKNLVMGEKEKAVLHEELDKKKKFQKGHKHNVKIQRKNIIEVEQKNKLFIKKLKDDNEELKGSIAQLKTQDELQNLKQKANIWETTKRKWTKTIVFS